MSSDAPTRQFCEGCNYSFVERDLALNSPMAPRHVVTCGHILCVSCLNKVLTTGLCPVQGDKVHGKKDTQPRTVADHPLAYSLINSTSTDVDASSSTDTAAECCEECQLIPNFTPLAATKGCGLCVEYFCDKHAEYHKSILADHVIVEKEQVQSYAKTITKDEQLMCALHKEPIVRYDKKCDLFICRFCDDEHGLHETTLAFEAFASARKVMKDFSKKDHVDGLLASIKTMQDDLTEALSELPFELDRSMENHRKELVSILDSAQKRLRSCAETVCGQYSQESARRAEALSEIAARLTQIEHTVKQTRALVARQKQAVREQERRKTEQAADDTKQKNQEQEDTGASTSTSTSASTSTSTSASTSMSASTSTSTSASLPLITDVLGSADLVRLEKSVVALKSLASSMASFLGEIEQASAKVPVPEVKFDAVYSAVRALGSEEKDTTLATLAEKVKASRERLCAAQKRSEGIDSALEMYKLGMGTIQKDSGHKLTGGQSNWSRNVQQSHNGKWLAAAFSNGVVEIWNLAKDSACTVDDSNSLTMKHDTIWGMVWHPKDGKLITGSENGLVCVWHHEDDVWSVDSCLKLKGGCMSMALEPSGSRIVVGTVSENALIISYPLNPKQDRLAALDHCDKSSKRSIRMFCVDWSADGKYIATGADDYSVMIWDSMTLDVVKKITKHTNELRTIKFSPCCSELLTSSTNAQIYIWDVATWDLLHETQVTSSHVFYTWTAEYHPSALTILLAASSSLSVYIMDRSLNMIQELKLPGSRTESTASFSREGSKVFVAAYGDIWSYDITPAKTLDV